MSDDNEAPSGKSAIHKFPVCGVQFVGSDNLDAVGTVCFDCIENLEDDLAGPEDEQYGDAVNRDMIVRAYKEPCFGDVIRIIAKENHGKVSAYAQPVVMKEVEEFTHVDPMIEISHTTAQGLMDSLWECGLRPSEGSGSAGQLASVQRHLEDMRSIAFHGLKMGKDGAK